MARTLADLLSDIPLELDRSRPVTPQEIRDLIAALRQPTAFVLGTFALQSIAINSTQFGMIGTTAFSTELGRCSVVPAPFTLRNLTVRTQTTQPSDGSLVITMRKNLADTPVTLTIAANAVSGMFSDNVNAAVYAAGDRIDFKLQNNSPAALSAQIEGMSFTMDLLP